MPFLVYVSDIGNVDKVPVWQLWVWAYIVRGVFEVLCLVYITDTGKYKQSTFMTVTGVGLCRIGCLKCFFLSM